MKEEQSHEIDSLADFEYVEFLIKHQGYNG
jgi:CMP-N-acetylneuraminic acid synthetase